MHRIVLETDDTFQKLQKHSRGYCCRNYRGKIPEHSRNYRNIQEERNFWCPHPHDLFISLLILRSHCLYCYALPPVWHPLFTPVPILLATLEHVGNRQCYQCKMCWLSTHACVDKLIRKMWVWVFFVTFCYYFYLKFENPYCMHASILLFSSMISRVRVAARKIWACGPLTDIWRARGLVRLARIDTVQPVIAKM